MSESDLSFACPGEMKYFSEKVFSGEYEVPYAHPAPKILDIGANCGAFSLWAHARWPGSQIFAYEPAQINFGYLQQNTKDFPEIQVSKKAVLASGRTKLYCGKNNQGEASFFPELNQTDGTYEVPEVIHPRELPECDILKIDTEGCELEILVALNAAGRLPKCILLEYHSEFDRRAIDIELRDYVLVGSHADCPDRGVTKYIRRKV